MASKALLKQGVERRAAIMAYLRRQRAKGISPSIGEISDHIGLKSRTATRRHLEILQQEGKLDLGVRNSHRSIRILDKPAKKAG